MKKKCIFIYIFFIIFVIQHFSSSSSSSHVLCVFFSLFLLSSFFRCPGGLDEITPKFGDANEMMASVYIQQRM
jgi:hypothetical protein